MLLLSLLNTRACKECICLGAIYSFINAICWCRQKYWSMCSLFPHIHPLIKVTITTWTAAFTALSIVTGRPRKNVYSFAFICRNTLKVYLWRRELQNISPLLTLPWIQLCKPVSFHVNVQLTFFITIMFVFGSTRNNKERILRCWGSASFRNLRVFVIELSFLSVCLFYSFLSFFPWHLTVCWCESECRFSCSCACCPGCGCFLSNSYLWPPPAVRWRSGGQRAPSNPWRGASPCKVLQKHKNRKWSPSLLVFLNSFPSRLVKRFDSHWGPWSSTSTKISLNLSLSPSWNEIYSDLWTILK